MIALFPIFVDNAAVLFDNGAASKQSIETTFIQNEELVRGFFFCPRSSVGCHIPTENQSLQIITNFHRSGFNIGNNFKLHGIFPS